MKEQIKSGLLILLITVSLVQSYFLIYRMPGADSVVNSDAGYVQAEDIGPRSTIENMILPDKMIVHMTGDRHTIFYPASTPYMTIYKELRESSFNQFRRLSIQSIDWNKIRSDAGIELTFTSGIPVSLLERAMDLNPDSLFEGDSVNRIWIYNAADSQTPKAYFFSASGDVVYEATELDWTTADVTRSVLLGENGINYEYMPAGYYVPQTGPSIPTVTLKMDSLTTQQMQRNLFFNPGATRNINEENGTEIYTDSKRSLQVDSRQKWMTYTDPTAPTAGNNNMADNVMSAVDFVNQHGGWPGMYMLTLKNNGENQGAITFREYYRSYPIMDTDKLKFGYIQLVVDHNTVSSYERSMLYLSADTAQSEESSLRPGSSANSRIQTLPGGEELQRMLDTQIEAGQQVVDLYPAYRPTLGNGIVILTPVWMVNLQSGETQVLKTL